MAVSEGKYAFGYLERADAQPDGAFFRHGGKETAVLSQ
jgi:hypothetical protein